MAQNRRLRILAGEAEAKTFLDNETTADPTVNDDSGDGYAIGSIWINTTLNRVFVAVDVTSTAAVWRRADTSDVVVDASNKVTGAKTITFIEHDNGESGASKTVSADNGQKQKIKLTTATPSITVTPPSSGVGGFRLRIIQDVTGGRAITWVGAVKFAGPEPDISALTANQYTIASIDFDDDSNINIQIPVDENDNALPFT